MAVWLVHKSTGVTSFEALEAARPPGKACHGGALDPFASGLLPVLVGPGVHLFYPLHQLPKTYLATLAFGAETDNLDPSGQVVARGDPSASATPAVATGWQLQVPPAFSNKRVGGVRAWRLAQAGARVELPPERVYLHRADWLDATRLRVVVRGGFYVRALARDLGRQSGARAHLAALHREQIGPWRCPPPGEPVRLELDAALDWLPTRALTDAEVGALRGRAPLAVGELEPAAWALPDGFPPLGYARAVHRGRTVALLRFGGVHPSSPRLKRPPQLPGDAADGAALALHAWLGPRR